jgi:NADPH:quinone reductase
MKAAVYYENGPPSVLKYEDVPDPVCHPKGVVIRVEAVSVEGGDTLNRASGPLLGRPHVVGYQAAGEIIAVGAEVTNLRVGQKVTTVNGHGSRAALRAVPARNAWPIPSSLPVKLAAAIPVPFGTADDCLFEHGKLREGSWVLVQAGASAVGIAAIQLAKRAGAKVIATASSDERLDKLYGIGLDHGINYKQQELVEEVRKVTDGKGVALVVDSVGTTIPQSVACLAYRGRVSLVGRAGRAPVSIDPTVLMGGNQSITGVFLGAEIMTDRVHDMIQRHIVDVAESNLEVIIDSEFPLREAARAHEHIESRRAFGRVLLIP